MSAENKAYIDEFGIHVPDYAAVLERRKAEYRGIYGDDTYLEEDSQDGAQVAILSLAEHDTNMLAESVYQSFSPRTSRGVGLSRMVKINGIERHAASHSTAPIRLVGQPGTTLPDDRVGDDAEYAWQLPKGVIIPPSGEITVTGTCNEIGSIRAGVGDIYRILTPKRGWQEAYNVEPATPGAPVEEDGDLRLRQTVSTALPSLTVLDGTEGAVANVKGVTRWRPYENDTDVTDANGIPPHHIAIVVEGGDAKEIAHAINVKKTPGTGTYGTTSVLTVDEYGVPKTIRFFYRTEVRIKASITIKAYYGYLAATDARIVENFVSAINTTQIGIDVLRSRLICPITSAETVAGARTFDIDLDDLLLGSDSLPLGAQNIPIKFNEVAVASTDDVTLHILRQKPDGTWEESLA